MTSDKDDNPEDDSKKETGEKNKSDNAQTEDGLKENLKGDTLARLAASLLDKREQGVKDHNGVAESSEGEDESAVESTTLDQDEEFSLSEGSSAHSDIEEHESAFSNELAFLYRVSGQADRVKNIIEAALFAAAKPLDRGALKSLFDENDQPSDSLLNKVLDELQNDYQDRGVELIQVSSGYRFQVRQESAPWVARLWDEKPARYSRALLETLVIIAYRQPVTRGEIEDIRGVSVSTNIIRTLMDREWIRVIGHRDVPGKPAMYATTRHFLDYFSLKKLEDLPPLSEIKDFDKINAELDFESDEFVSSAESQAESENEAESAEQELAKQPETEQKAISPDEDGVSLEDTHHVESGQEEDHNDAMNLEETSQEEVDQEEQEHLDENNEKTGG